MKSGRGLNVIAWHPMTFKQLLARSYDTHGDKKASYRMMNDLGKLTKGAIIAVACKDECARYLDKNTKQTFAWHGSKYISVLKQRESFAFIGRKGFRNSAVEQRNGLKHRSVLSWKYKVHGGKRTIKKATKTVKRNVGLPRIMRMPMPRRSTTRSTAKSTTRRIVRTRGGIRRSTTRKIRMPMPRGRIVGRRGGIRRTVRRRGGNGQCRGACLRKINNLKRQLRQSRLRWSK